MNIAFDFQGKVMAVRRFDAGRATNGQPIDVVQTELAASIEVGRSEGYMNIDKRREDTLRSNPDLTDGTQGSASAGGFGGKYSTEDTVARELTKAGKGSKAKLSERRESGASAL